MSFTSLTAGERYPAYALVGKQCTVREIGAAPGRDKGTVSRQLRRNREGKGYLPKQSQTVSDMLPQVTHNARQLPPETWAAAETMLRQEHRLEQV